MRLMQALFTVALLAGSLLAHARELAPVERQKIEYLIASIETSGDAQFIRNGTAYSARAAADHLRLKLRNAGSKVRTAEDFIQYCASTSSTTGEPYQIRFPSGQVMTSEAYLRQKLLEFHER